MARPDGFPPQIDLFQADYENWDGTIRAKDVWTCAPRSAQEIAAVCTWAARRSEPWRVRPQGSRHNWSPLTLDPSDSPERTILCDMRSHLNAIDREVRWTSDGVPTVRAQLGATLEDLLETLEQLPGGRGSAPGFGFLHTPAPGGLTLGGILAINGHGTAVPNPLDPRGQSFGSLSNQILECTAIVSQVDATGQIEYVPKHFVRGGGDEGPFLVHLGRAFLVDVVLQVVDNYNLRCWSTMDIDASRLFRAPSGGTNPKKSLAHFLEQSGRVEAIWYPFTDEPWLKVWSRSPQRPKGARHVESPYNYPFSDQLPDFVTTLIRKLTARHGEVTDEFGQMMEFITKVGLFTDRAGDLWGPSKNTLLYIRESTLRITANGYAVQMRRGDVQRAVSEFAAKWKEMLRSYRKQDKYPVNSPLEIRVTGLDDPSKIWREPDRRPETPPLSSLRLDAEALRRGFDVALWIDVLTLPGTPDSNAFYAELDEWIFANYSGYARPMPEWSKGWAYHPEHGPWRSEATLQRIRDLYGAAWREQDEALQEYDTAGLFSNAFLERLFG